MHRARHFYLLLLLSGMALVPGCHEEKGAVAVYSKTTSGVSETIYLKPDRQYYQTVRYYSRPPSYGSFGVGPDFAAPVSLERKGVWTLLNCSESSLLSGSMPDNALVVLKSALGCAPFQETSVRFTSLDQIVPAKDFKIVSKTPH